MVKRKWNDLKKLWIAGAFVLITPLAQAEGFSFDGERCQVELNYDMKVSPTQMVVSENSGELYRFEGGTLFIGDQKIQLNQQQQQQFEQFQQQLHQGSAMLSQLVQQALALAVEIVDEVLRHFDIKSDSTEMMFADLRQQIEAAIGQQGDTFTFATEMIEQTENEMGQLLENNLETVISESMGQMMVAIGQAMISGEGDFTERMEAFAQSVNELEQQIETRVEQGSAQIEQQGEQLCQYWLELDQTEKQLHQQIPQLKPYQLVVSSDNELGFLR